MAKKVLVPIADGTEELEAVTLVDVLRRADASVTVASVGALQVTASRGVKLVADRLIGDCVDEDYDLIVLPGGMPGAEHLRDCQDLVRLLKRQQARGGYFGAICASPAVVLDYHGLLSGKRVTCYPSFMGKLREAEPVQESVVVDGLCITSQGPGTALALSLKLVEVLYGPEKAKDVAQDMVATGQRVYGMGGKGFEAPSLKGTSKNCLSTR
jgi:4-methyl-5(b-hydroxyethyl)-thiazole monophosphate biosynthesis